MHLLDCEAALNLDSYFKKKFQSCLFTPNCFMRMFKTLLEIVNCVSNDIKFYCEEGIFIISRYVPTNMWNFQRHGCQTNNILCKIRFQLTPGLVLPFDYLFESVEKHCNHLFLFRNLNLLQWQKARKTKPNSSLLILWLLLKPHNSAGVFTIKWLAPSVLGMWSSKWNDSSVIQHNLFYMVLL